MAWTIVVVGMFFDTAIANGFMGFRIQKREAVIWDGGTSTFSTSTNSRVGEAVASALLNPANTANQYLYISSFETSQNQILACLKDVTGDDWKVSEVSSRTKIRESLDVIKSGATGLPMLIANGTLSLAAMYSGEGGEKYGSDFVKSGRSSNEKLGLLPEDMEVAIRSIVDRAKQ